MKESVRDIIENMFLQYPAIAGCRDGIEKSFLLLKACYEQGGKVMVCGNGGSASDSEHIVGELMKGFLMRRKIIGPDRDLLVSAFSGDGEHIADCLQGALPAISLVSHTSLMTAFANDIATDMVFAQQVYGYGRAGDVLIGLSTSGNSANVINAIMTARAFGVKTIGFTGSSGGKMKDLCDAVITVPALETYKIQEYHLPVYHALCAAVEAEFFKE